MYVFLGVQIGDNGVAVHLFYRALRLHDNKGLTIAASSCTKLIPLYIFNTKRLGLEIISLNRIDAIIQALFTLDEEFRVLGSRLFVAIGDPVNVMRQILHNYSVCMVTCEKVQEPEQK